MKEIFKKSLRITARVFKWILIVFILLFVLIFAVWKVPAIHNFAVKKATSFFNEKTGGDLSIGAVDLRLPFFIGLEQINLQTPEGQKLASIETLEIYPGWRMLFAQTIRVDEINLSGVDGKIFIKRDGSFNFDFITEGFSDSTATQTEESDTTASGWGFSLGDLNLNEVKFTYADRSTGDSIDLNIGAFELDMDELDLENQAYLAESISLENTNVYAQISAGESESTESTEPLPTLGLDELEVANTQIRLKLGDDPPYQFDLGKVHLETDKIDLNTNTFLVDELLLADSRFFIPLPAEAAADSEPQKSQSTDDAGSFFPELTAELAELEIENLRLRAFTKSDTLHRLSDLELRAKDIHVGNEGFALNLQNLQGSYNDFTDLKEFKGDFALRQTDARAADVVVKYGSSQINLNAVLSYADVEELLSKNRFTNLDATIGNTRIARSDIKNIYAALDMDTLPVPAADVFLVLDAKGNKEQVDLSQLKLTTGQTSIGLNAFFIAGRDSLWPGNLTLNKLNIDATQADLLPYLAYLEIDPAQIPSSLSLKVKGAYTAAKAKLDGVLESPLGDVDLIISGDGWDAKKQGLMVRVNSDKLSIGEYLKMPETLEADFSLFAETENIADSVLHLCTELDIDTLNYADYKYTNLMLDAELDGQNALFAFSIADTFVKADFGGTVDFAEAIDAVISGNINGIDLQGLNYAEKDIRGTLDFYARFRQDSLTTDAYASIDQILFVKEGDRFPLEPIEVDFFSSPDSTRAIVNAGFMELNSISNRGVDSLTVAIAEVLARGEQETSLDSSAFWNLKLNIDNLDEIGELFLPQLREFNPSTAEVKFSAADNELMANAVFPRIRYGAFSMDSLSIKSNDGASENQRSLTIKKMAYDSLALTQLDLIAERTQEGIDLLLTINPDTSDHHYRIAGALDADSVYLRNGYTLQFNDTLILNGKKWNYDDQCCIRSSDAGMSLEAFRLYRDNQSVSLKKDGDDFPLELEAENFPIRAVLGMFNTEQDLLGGLLSGHLSLNNDGTFEGKGNIGNFLVSGAEFGKLTWEASQIDDVFRTKIRNQGDLVDFLIEGNIIPESDSTSALDLTFRLNQFQLKTLENVLHSSIAEASGNLQGEISIDGNTARPLLDGSISFTDVGLQPRVSEAKYSVKNDRIIVESDRIVLNKFELSDPKENTLTLDGTVTHDNFSNPEMDMRIYGQDFMLIDLYENARLGLFGKLVADLDLTITGNLDAPEVDADIRILEPTDFTYVISSSPDQEAFEESLLVWTNFEENPENEIISRKKKEEQFKGNVFTNNPKIKGNLEIDESAIFKVLVDTSAGDYLQVQGSSKLSIDYDRTGTLRFNGVYEVSEGFYQLSFYDLVKRRFDFREGSRLVWNGEPTNANVNITAAYEKRAGIANLMLTDPSANYENSYQQQLPFSVLLNIEGKLLAPEISFGIELAESAEGALNGSVQARLNELKSNESALNKQVFALLVLGSFLPQSGGSDSNVLANQARNSASQVLTNQLNTLSDKYVQGIDINFDLNSYGGNAGEGNTDLSVNLAKSFADDRIVVKVGSTIALEQDNARAAQSQQVMTNVEIEYKLTPDGRYRLIAFSKTDLEDIVIGRITRSGGGFVFQKDFDRFRHLFDPKKQEENTIGQEEEKEEAESDAEVGSEESKEEKE